MRKLLPLLLVVSTACLADVVLKNAGATIGPVTALNCESDGGVLCKRTGTVGTLVCNAATTLETGCVTSRAQAFAGQKTHVDVLSAPGFDGGFASLTGNMGSKTATVTDTADDTALFVSGIGTATGAGLFQSSGTGKHAVQWGYYGSCTGCCLTHSCGPSAGAKTGTLEGNGDINTAGAVTATGAITSSAAVTGASLVTGGALSVTGNTGLGGTLLVVGNAGLAANLTLLSFTDDSATPGSRTVNKVCGKSSIASGAKAATITDSFAAATSQVIVTPEFVDATCLYLQAAIPAAGSFTVTLGPANCTAATKFSWCVIPHS